MITLPVCIAGVRRMLPIREVKPGVRVAVFNLLGDVEMTEAAGQELARRLPPDVDVLLMPEGKALALLHVVARESKRPSVVVRKEHKPYMAQPVLSASLNSITTDHRQMLHLDANDAKQLKGQRVAFVDDVVSTGGTLEACRKLVEMAGGQLTAILAIFTEGDKRTSVIALDHLPNCF